MKRAIIIIFSALFSLPIFGQGIKDIDIQLQNIGTRDQSIRLNVMHSQQKGNIDSLIYYIEQMAKIDAENQLFVADLIRTQGIPDGLSKEAYSAIFLVVDHAEITYQKRYFKPLKQAAKEGKIKQSEINTLYDRIMMRSNRRQLFGTQTQSHTRIIEGETLPKQVCYLWPVRRARTLDKRRKEAGQAPISAQIETYKKVANYEMVWDKTLSVRKFKKMMDEQTVDTN